MNLRRAFSLLFKCVAVVIYDGVVLFGLALFVSLLTVIVTPRHEVPPETLWFQALLLSTWVFYITLSLKNGGQTLGMKAWQMRWQGLQGKSWPRAVALVTAFTAGVIAATILLVRLFL